MAPARSLMRAAILATLSLLIGRGAIAQALQQRTPANALAASDSIAAFIAEASVRFGVPQEWIRAVMRVESAADPLAVSAKGAMGLMQLMPATWAALRVRYGLGVDPFDPRDNILAGAAYLRELYDRYGASGFLAAYNAGPGRYEDHLMTGRALPGETRAYVAALTPAVIGGAPNATRNGESHSCRGQMRRFSSRTWRHRQRIVIPCPTNKDRACRVKRKRLTRWHSQRRPKVSSLPPRAEIANDGRWRVLSRGSGAPRRCIGRGGREEWQAKDHRWRDKSAAFGPAHVVGCVQLLRRREGQVLLALPTN